MLHVARTRGEAKVGKVRLFGLTAIQARENDSKWDAIPRTGRWCFVAAYDAEDARRIAGEKLTPGRFASPWSDKKLTAANPAHSEGPVPEYGWVGDIAGKWTA